jgi:hypothetical protein
MKFKIWSVKVRDKNVLSEQKKNSVFSAWVKTDKRFAVKKNYNREMTRNQQYFIIIIIIIIILIIILSRVRLLVCSKFTMPKKDFIWSVFLKSNKKNNELKYHTIQHKRTEM